jgi:hypothetical protein
MPAKADRLFAMTTAYVTMEASLDLRPSGVAGIVFKPLETADFGDVTADLDELLDSAGQETGTRIERHTDEFDYRWTILRDADFEDLVTSLNVVSESLEAAGYSEQLLCAVFAFDRAASGKHDGGTIYWIYNYKRGSFYPFVPRPGKARDIEAELRLRGALASELPLEREPERWFPLWDIPF